MLPCMSLMRKTMNIKGAAAVLGLSAAFLVLALLSAAFLVVTIILIVLGFAGYGGITASIVKICMFVFLVLFVISLILGRLKAAGSTSK